MSQSSGRLAEGLAWTVQKPSQLNLESREFLCWARRLSQDSAVANMDIHLSLPMATHRECLNARNSRSGDGPHYTEYGKQCGVKISQNRSQGSGQQFRGVMVGVME